MLDAHQGYQLFANKLANKLSSPGSSLSIKDATGATYPFHFNYTRLDDNCEASSHEVWCGVVVCLCVRACVRACVGGCGCVGVLVRFICLHAKHSIQEPSFVLLAIQSLMLQTFTSPVRALLVLHFAGTCQVPHSGGHPLLVWLDPGLR